MREIPDCELTDNPDYERWAFETARTEWESEEKMSEEQEWADRRENMMDTKQWRELGYTVIFQDGFVYLYYKPTRKTFAQPVNRGAWMNNENTDLWMVIATPKNFHQIAETCYCSSLFNSNCDFCTNLRPVS